MVQLLSLPQTSCIALDKSLNMQLQSKLRLVQRVKRQESWTDMVVAIETSSADAMVPA